MVPEHHLLSEKEAEAVLEELGIGMEQLPKIRQDDAAIKILELVEGEIPEGSVVRIVRKSDTAYQSVAYRLVVER